jgi:hypothetical protein
MRCCAFSGAGHGLQSEVGGLKGGGERAEINFSNHKVKEKDRE